MTEWLSLTFFIIGMKTDLFQSCGHCWVFQICWHIEYSTLTASSLRIWNSSAGILSPPLPWFIVMLPKAYLSLHSSVSGSRWVITSLWLSGSWRSFSVHSCHLFLISSASFRSISFLSFIVPIFAWNFPFVSLIYLKRSLVFPILLFSSISLHWTLRKAFFSHLAVLWDWNENWYFPSCGHCWAFQICWHIEYSTLTASSFMIWNSLAGIPSPPLTLLLWYFLRPTWLHIPRYLALGEWSHHHGFLGH